MEIIPLGFGYYLSKLDNDDDREPFLLDGPWTVQVHYLMVRQWSPNFTPSADSIKSMLAWIWLPEFSMMYYNEDLLYALASSIGTSVKIDINIRLTTRGQFARVCIKIDLMKPLVD